MYNCKVVKEDVYNSSVCVLEEDGIRLMKYDDDINKNLVYVSSQYSGAERIVHSGTYVNYFPVAIINKFQKL